MAHSSAQVVVGALAQSKVANLFIDTFQPLQGGVFTENKRMLVPVRGLPFVNRFSGFISVGTRPTIHSRPGSFEGALRSIVWLRLLRHHFVQVHTCKLMNNVMFYTVEFVNVIMGQLFLIYLLIIRIVLLASKDLDDLKQPLPFHHLTVR